MTTKMQVADGYRLEVGRKKMLDQMDNTMTTYKMYLVYGKLTRDGWYQPIKMVLTVFPSDVYEWYQEMHLSDDDPISKGIDDGTYAMPLKLYKEMEKEWIEYRFRCTIGMDIYQDVLPADEVVDAVMACQDTIDEYNNSIRRGV